MLRRLLGNLRGGSAPSEPAAQAEGDPRIADAAALAHLEAGRLDDALAGLARGLGASAATPELHRLLVAGLVDLARKNPGSDGREKIAYLLGTALLSLDDVEGAALCARARALAPPPEAQVRAFRIDEALVDYCRRNGLPCHTFDDLALTPMAPDASSAGLRREAFACALAPGLVLGGSFIPASDDGFAFPQHSLYRAAKVHEFDAPAALRTVLFATGTRMLAAATSTLKLAGPHVLLGSNENFGHWLLNHYSRLAVAGRIPGLRDARYLVGSDLKPAQLECLERAGIPESRVVRVPPTALVRCETLWVPAMLYGYFERMYWAPAQLAFIRRALQLDFSPPRTRRVFLSRASARWRRLVNEAEVFEALRPQGFELVDPGALTLGEQAALAASAQVIVGTMGAGMNLLMLAPEGTPIVTLKGPLKGRMDIDPYLTRELHQPYTGVEGTPLATDPDPLKCDIEASPAAVLAVVQRVLSARA